MDKREICEAMYASHDGVVIRRKKSVAMPLAVTLAGIALLVLDNLSGSALGNDLSSAAVFIGGMVTLFGGAWFMVRLFDKEGTPYHGTKHEYLRYEELYFDRKYRQVLLEAVSAGDTARIMGVPRTQVPAMVVQLYRCRDNTFAAMQAHEYIDLEYRPISDVKITDGLRV